MLAAVLDRQALIVPSVVTKTNFADPEIVPIGTGDPLDRSLAGPATGNSSGCPSTSLAALYTCPVTLARPSSYEISGPFR
jgi:hypothetical protein